MHKGLAWMHVPACWCLDFLRTLRAKGYPEGAHQGTSLFLTDTHTRAGMRIRRAAHGTNVEQDGEGRKEGSDEDAQVCRACWSTEGLGEGAWAVVEDVSASLEGDRSRQHSVICQWYYRALSCQ